MPDTNETALEKTFSDLAYSHLRDKSQALLDYLVGFQMLKQEDDGKRAVGIFGFEISDDYYYAPIFFLNGEIRGLESMYSPKSDMFIPLTDDWVNTIINRRQMRLGDKDTRSRAQRGIHVPNYTKLKIIPGGTGGTNLKLAEAMSSGREYGEIKPLPELLAQEGLGSFFKEAMVRHPRLFDAVSQYYSLLDFPDTPPPQQKVAAEEAVIVINSIADEGVDALTDDQREDMLEGGTIVIDKRPEVNKSQLYSTETKRILENPTGGGLYDLLWSDGSVFPALVSPTNSGCNMVFVYCPDREDRYCTIDSSCVWALRKYTRVEYLEWLKKNSGEADSVRPGEVVVFISDTGEGTEPLCISQVTEGLDGTKTMDCHLHYAEADKSPSYAHYDFSRRGDNGNPPHNTFMDLRIGGNGDHEFPPITQRPGNPYHRIIQVLVVGQGNDVPRMTERHLVVNSKHFRAIVVNTFRLEKPEYDNTNTASSKVEVYNEPRYDATLKYVDFGNYNTVQQTVDKIASDLKVWKTGSDINIKCASADSFVCSHREGDLIRHLVKDLGFGESDARLVIKEASVSPKIYKATLVSKTAAELLNVPDIQDTDLGGFLTSFHRQQIPFETLNRASSPQNREFYMYQSPFGSGTDGESSDDTFSILEDAAKTGQRDVFDAGALASLIKSHNPTDLVERFLPALTAAMDRLGRMLFLIYWHYQDFEDRYGDNDLTEFIDNINSVFEQLGDVIVFARKRTLAGDPEHYGLGALPIMEEATT